MSKIRLLDDITVQKIAAGEVVERPASIVKELVENSLDANAGNIVIEIKNGGKSYIRITDDGDGMSSEDLDLAFEKHSTSKLREIDDLYRITSLGFRGEALSSISTVARVEVMTKTEDSLGGVQAILEEGKIISKNVVGTPKGTTMIVRDLFYNLPVRKDFLKSDLVETNRIADVVYKIAIGNPDCTFRYIKDGEVILTTSKNNNFKNHIYTILGREFSNNLVDVEYEGDELTIRGYISNNQLYRGNRSHQYLYINGRYIDNQDISRNIENQYRSVIPLNRFPVYILFLEIDPGKIDVNIHPTKQEIKFSNQEELMDIINKVVSEGLQEDITIPKASFNRKKKTKEVESLPLLFEMGREGRNIIRDEDIEKNIPDEDKETIIIKDLRDSDLNIDDDIYIKETGKKLFTKSEIDDLKNQSDNPYDNNKTPSNFKAYDDTSKQVVESSPQDLEENKNSIHIDETLENIKPLGVIFSTYILAEDKINDKFYFIDQHAAHERVMYERYLDEFKNESINTQQLLAAEIIELTNNEINLLEENQDLFKNLGFDIDIFGTGSIIIRGVPIVFGSPNVKNLFMDILDNIHLNPSSSYDLRVEKIMKISCVNSIKSGDNIKDEEILALFDQLKKCKNPHSCPHGRPTMIEMTRKDIEKEFLRIM